MAKEIERRCLEIERNFYLEGSISELKWLFCGVTVSTEINGKISNYALLYQGVRFGFRELGCIDPLTREFKKFYYENKIGQSAEVTIFDRDYKNKKDKFYVPISQLKYLKTLDEVLSIPGISIKK